jgi:hypothetical protein
VSSDRFDRFTTHEGELIELVPGGAGVDG